MKSLVIYDSVYGNTEQIAGAIGNALDAEVLCIDEVTFSQLSDFELIIIGSPVHGGRATPMIEEFLQSLASNTLSGKKVAAFDTRFAAEEHGFGLKFLMNVTRYAAERIARDLVSKGGTLIAEPEGFIVDNKKGPLKKGELERATTWAKGLV